MKRFYMESPSTGVIFMITENEGQYKIHIRAIPENNGVSYVPVYSKCIRKYFSIKECNNFLDRFEAKTDEEKETYVARYYRGIGNQRDTKPKHRDFVVVRAVTKQLFVQRGNGKWTKHDTFSNPHQLARAIKGFESRGRHVCIEPGVIRYYKIPKEELIDAHNILIIEEEDHTQLMTIGEKKRAQRASFWSNR
jgi:hypothetical protein